MQTTLLGLGIAIILALVAALVAPLVVDWSHYRSAFESEASRLTGMSVRVNGTIDARILPTPLITLRNVEAGAAGQAPQLRAGTLELEIGLGPLLRGEVQASQVRLVAPQINIGLDRSGAVAWPAPSPSFRPEALSVSHFIVTDGRVILTDAASGSRLALQKLSFDGDIRSFLGPFGGAGDFEVGSEPFSYRISGGRADGDRGLRIRLGVDPSNHPLTTDIDGMLTMDHGQPQFEGTLALARPVGATLSSGQRVMNDPWHAAGKIKATAAAASLQDLAFQYGPDERPLNFAGHADLTFGDRPHLDGTVSAMQLDVDRALADPDATHRPPLLVFKSFLEAFVAAVRLPMPADIGVGVDAVTVGGTAIQSLHGNMHFDESGWSLRDFAFHAPGLTQANISGRLSDTPQGFAFAGPASLESADVDMLLAWLGGSGDATPGQSKTLTARGNVTIAGDRVAVDGLTASLDRENVEGKVAYAWAAAGHPAILDADLRAATLDLDALAAFGKTAADYGLALPHQGSLALDVDKATSTGVDARKVNARIKFDGGALQIDRLSIGELGGAALDISGRIDELSSRPRGKATFDLNASALAGLTNVVGKFAPKAANSLRRFADRLAPAKVHAVLTVEPAATAGGSAKLDLDGQLGLMRISLNGEASGEPSRLGEANVRIKSRLDADDGSVLATLFGLDHVIGLDQLPGSLSLSMVGPLNGDLRVDGQVAASGIAATVGGGLRLQGDKAPAGALQVQASVADLRPLAQAMTGQPGTAVPLSARAAVSIAGTDLSFTEITAAAGKASLHGRLNLDLAGPVAIDGEVNADDVDAAQVSAMLLGLPRVSSGAGGLWSGAAIGAGAFAAMNGAVTFKFDRAVFTPALTVRELKGAVRFHPAEIALENLDGIFCGGRLTGDLAFRRNADMIDAHGRVELAGADAPTLLGSGAKAVDGKLTLKIQYGGIGASPIDLVHSLEGGGTVSIADARLTGLDASVFDAVMRTADADRSAKIEPAKVQAAVSAAMQNGHLAAPQGEATATLSGGKIRVANVTLPAQGGTAALMLNGALDLSDGAVDARVTLRGHPGANALIRMQPELAVMLKGPLAAPARTLDTSALTSWLTLRAAELQARRLESIEANRREGMLGSVVRPESPAIRTVPPGAVIETAMPASLSAMRAFGARDIERLLPVPPPAAPAAAATAAPAATAEQKPRPAPAQPAPQAAVPAHRSLLDLLFGSQN